MRGVANHITNFKMNALLLKIWFPNVCFLATIFIYSKQRYSISMGESNTVVSAYTIGTYDSVALTN